MAAVTLLGTQTFNTNSGTKTVTATPAVGDLIVIVTAHTGNTSATAPTDNNSGGGGTYTQAPASALKATSADSLRVWVRDALVTSATSTVFTHAPGASTGGGLGVLKVTGMARVGSLAFRQAAKQDNQGAATPAPAFSVAALTGNAVIGAVFNATSPATLTARTNFTERFDVGYSTPTAGLEVMSRDSGETGTTQTWGSASGSAFCSIVVELDATAMPAITQAAYRFAEDGLESNAPFIAAVDTNITKVLPADDYLGLRLRLQETAGGSAFSTDDYQLQYELNDSGSWETVQAAGESVNSSYAEANWDNSLRLNNLFQGSAQTFTSGGGALTQAKFYIAKVASATGTAVAKLYAITGTLGSTSKPTGSALATSATVDVSTLSTSLTLVTFTFSGAEQYAMSNGTNYAISVEFPAATSSNSIDVGQDVSSPSHAGNGAQLAGASWFEESADYVFYVYSSINPAVVPYASNALVNDAATTNRAGNGTGSFVAGEVSTDGLVDDLQITASNYTNLLYSLKLVYAQLSDGDTLDFRVLRNGATTTMTYSVTPRITIDKVAPSAMSIATGTHSGTGSQVEVTTGFDPDVVWLTRTDTAADTIFWSKFMPAPLGYFSARIRNDTALQGSRIVSHSSTGFTVDTNSDVNASGGSYEWVAFKWNGLEDFRPFVYRGTGGDDRNITGIFPTATPAWAMVKGDTANTGSHIHEDEADGNSLTFYGGAEQTDRLQNVVAGGIQVGTGVQVNGSGTAYYGFAFGTISGRVNAVSYTGDGADNRSLTTPGIDVVKWALIKQAAGQLPYWWSPSFDAGKSVAVAEATQADDRIQGAVTGGVELGTAIEVNENASTYYGIFVGEAAGGAPATKKNLSTLGVS